MKRVVIALSFMLIICLMVSCSKNNVVNNSTEEQIEDNKEEINSEEDNNVDKAKEDKDDEKEKEEEASDINLVPEQVGELISIGDSAVEVFGGNEENARLYAQTISEYAELLSDKNVYNIIIPSHIEFILPEKYSDLSSSQKDNIEIIKNTESKKVKFVDAYSELKKHKDEYIYFKSDHHWTALGAYYAYCAYAKKAGFEPIKLEDYSAKRKENFLGTFYGSTQDPELAANPDYVEYYSVGENCIAYLYEDTLLNNPLETTVYAEYAEESYSYGVFLHGDNPLMKIVNEENTSGKKIVVVKESYGNAFVPFLIPHYSEVYVVDLRYFGNNLVNFINNNNISDVVFINNTFAANTTMHIDKLREMK